VPSLVNWRKKRAALAKMRYKISPPPELSQIEQVTVNEIGLLAGILASVNPRRLPVPVRYKISLASKFLCFAGVRYNRKLRMRS
jgi:hypothetical protein